MSGWLFQPFTLSFPLKMPVFVLLSVTPWVNLSIPKTPVKHSALNHHAHASSASTPCAPCASPAWLPGKSQISWDITRIVSRDLGLVCTNVCHAEMSVVSLNQPVIDQSSCTGPSCWSWPCSCHAPHNISASCNIYSNYLSPFNSIGRFPLLW